MDPIVWPTRLLVPGNVKLSLQNPSRGGGQSATGTEQVVVSPAARWAITFSSIAIRTKQHVLAWRAIEAQADGRANAILVPVYDWSRRPVRSEIENGITFDSTPFLPSASSIALAANAAVNATSLSVTWAAGPAPQPGQHFAIGNGLHRVATLTPTGTRAGTMTVRPWLRSAASAGTALDFDDPQCLVRLAKDDGMDLDLQLWRFATPSVDFLEAS